MRKKIRGILGVLAMGVAIFTFVGCQEKKEDKEIIISIAASLEKPMNKIGEKFTKETGVKVIYNTGSSGTLKKQIEDGAKVDIFISANTNYIDELVEKNYIKDNETYKILSNSLVVIAEKNKKELKSLESLKNTTGKIGIGEIKTVPAGIYAKEALEKTGVFKEVENRLIYGRNVTSVKQYVENGEVSYGFVYGSDALNLKNSKVVFEVLNGEHKKIEYALGIVDKSQDKNLDLEFVKFLKGDEAKNIFKEYGFSPN